MHRLSTLILGGLVLAACAHRVDRQEIVEARVPCACGRTTRDLRYLLYRPPGYEESATNERRWPLIVYLHGLGGEGSDIRGVARVGLPRRLEDGGDIPFLVASPQKRVFLERWSPREVFAVVDDVSARCRVDATRVYLTGLSLGAAGVWEAAIAHPDRVAAIVPAAGWGDRCGIERLTEVPVWAFHGALDFIVPLPFQERMIEAHREVGGHARWTVIPLGFHWIWRDVYERDDLYDWLLAHARPGATGGRRIPGSPPAAASE